MDPQRDAVATDWHDRAMAAAVRKLLEVRKCRTILGVGAGALFFSRDLIAHGYSSEAWCVDPAQASDEDVDEHGRTLHLRRTVDAVSADVLLLVDVLEHADDDVALLNHHVAKVPPGTTVLVVLPAFGFLGRGHERRYTLHEVQELVIKAGLQVDRSAYYFGLLFPWIALSHLIAQRRAPVGTAARPLLRAHGRFVDGLLATICRLELPLMAHNRFAGSTAFCVATKP